MTVSLLYFSVVLSIFLFAGATTFKLAIENSNAVRWNHAFILSLYALAIFSAIWFLFPDRNDTVNLVHILIGKGIVTITNDEKGPNTIEQGISYCMTSVLPTIYIGGIFLMGMRFVISIFKIIKLIICSKKQTVNGISIRVHNYHAFVPCSFGHIILIPDNLVGDELGMVVEHEYAHARKHHWIGQLMAEVVIILSWYNPASYILRNSLRDVQEYEADNAVITAGYPPMKYQMLLIRTAVGKRFDLLANNLNNSSLNKRIKMMKITKTRLVGLVARTFAVIPALAMAFVISSMVPLNAMSSTEPSVIQQAESPRPTHDNNLADKSAAPIESMPSFPGGESAFYQCISELLEYPDDVKVDKEQRVVVGFKIGVDGAMSDFYFVKKSNNSSFNAAAMDALKKIQVKWIPATKDGKPVAAYFVIPINFKLK